jgi:hypothetical protein
MVRYKRYAVFLRYQFTRSALIQLEPSNVILSLYHRECEAGIQILQSNGHHHYCQVNVGDSERNEMLEQQQSTLFLRLETDEGSTPSNTTEDSGEKVANKDALAMMLRQPTGGGDEEGEEEDDMFGDDDDIPLEEPSPSTKKGATKAHGRKASKSKSKSGKSEGEHTVCVCACDYVFIRVCVCVCAFVCMCECTYPLAHFLYLEVCTNIDNKRLSQTYIHSQIWRACWGWSPTWSCQCRRMMVT